MEYLKAILLAGRLAPYSLQLGVMSPNRKAIES